MRDTLKDYLFFDALIQMRYSLIDNVREKLKNNEIKLDRLNAATKLMFFHYTLILRAKYCRGDNMRSEEVMDDYNNTAILFNEYSQEGNVNLLTFTEGTKITFLNQYILSVHFDVLDLLALGTLLNVPEKDFNLIVDVIDKDNVKNFLYEFLIRDKIPNRLLIQEENFKEFPWYKDRFSKLKKIIRIDDKNIAQDELKSFLEKDWYQLLHDTPIYNQHNVKNGNYVGYWCFAAAAIVKIKGLDDSSFRDNQYYPKDLV